MATVDSISGGAAAARAAVAEFLAGAAGAEFGSVSAVDVNAAFVEFTVTDGEFRSFTVTVRGGMS